MFALVIFWMSLKIGHVGSKSRSLGQILEKPCVRCRGHISVQYSWNLVRMFVLMISWTSMKMCYVGWKTRSQGEILEKLSVWMTLRKKPFEHSLKMRKCWYPAFFPFFTMFSTPLRDQSHSLIHILFVLCKRFRLMSLKFYCLIINISHKMLEIGCAWSKGSGERLQGHHGPLV